jgi:hypothetical protein
MKTRYGRNQAMFLSYYSEFRQLNPQTIKSISPFLEWDLLICQTHRLPYGGRDAAAEFVCIEEQGGQFR